MNKQLPTPPWPFIAFWAFVESGLGGMMHAFHLPFTGIFIGGAAVVTLGAIAHSHRSKYGSAGLMKQLLSATAWVMAVKLMVSPHSPPTSYIAVGFQGLWAACCYQLIPSHRWASVVFAVMAMLESALQKMLLLFLIFGSDFWESVSIWMKSVAKQLDFAPIQLEQLVVAYVLLYAAWGLFLGLRLGSWPKRLEAQASSLAIEFAAYQGSGVELEPRRRRGWKRFLFLGVLGVLAFVIPLEHAWESLARAMAISFMLYATAPWFLHLLRKALGKKQESAEMAELLVVVGRQSGIFQFCWNYHRQKRAFSRVLAAVESSLALAVLEHAQIDHER